MIEELRKVRMARDGRYVIKHLNLKVKSGQVLAVIGPNGSGKTTLLRMMALIDKPSGGEIYYNGKKAGNSIAKAIRGKATMVFQKSVNLNRTVYKNVAYGLELRKTPEGKIKKKVSAALELVGIKKLVNRRSKRLSGGEQQRVAIARALALEPELLLLDEPTANLDPRNTRQIERIIKKIKKKATVVIATNNPFQAARLSDRVVCLFDGRIIGEGAPREIVDRPRDARIKKFVRGELI
ncbi:MAG: ATP-binding cassette domain-containing protein [Candidatus Hadarchaeota archaeon]